MSLQEISLSIANFFESKNSTIYCLSGEWGVGKTYLFNEICNDFLKKNPSNFNNIKLPQNNLIKISLFGVSSVDDLKHKIIAEKLENSEAINLVSKALKYSLNHAKLKVPFVDFDQKKILESLFFNKFSNDLLICFDDIERKSPSLRIIDFLGFVSMLKEKYNCKIFLILNDHILDNENKNDYKKYFEKVVDHHIKFISNPRDALKITLEKKHSFDEGIKNILIKKIEFLNITNIRIIDKILTHSRLLLNRLNQAIKTKVEQETIDHALIALCLFCDGFYSLPNLNNEDKPAIEDILNPENKIYNNKKQQNFLWNLGYIETELFQIKIYEFILNGFFDSNFDIIANEYNKKFEIGTKQYKYDESWRVGFYGSFDDNGDEIINNIYNVFRDGIEVMSLNNLNSVCILLNDYGWNDKAMEAKNLYYENHKNDEEKFYIYKIFGDKNEEIINFCTDSLRKIKQNNLPNIEIAVENFLNNKNNSENNDYLNQTSLDKYYKFFKESKINNNDKLFLAKDFENAKSALEKIGKESAINKIRIEYPYRGFKLKP